MEIKFTRKTDSDFRKHRDYLVKSKKRSGCDTPLSKGLNL